ncbi:MAG: LPS export ABC transporter periplasmic protein LptC [Gemmatimonadales bacterium]
MTRGTICLGAAVLVLSACRDRGVQPTQTVVTADTADQVLLQMSHYLTRDGVRRSQVEADTAFIYEPTQTVEMRVMTVTFFNNTGEIASVLTADSGDYHWQDGSMTARGNVVGRSRDGTRVLRTTVLHYEPETGHITTDQPFTFRDGTDNLEGTGFESDPDFRNVIVDQPRGASGGARPLPGQ